MRQTFSVGPTINIASSTFATPIVVTTATAHGYTTGDEVNVLNHLVNTGAVGIDTVTVLSPTTFELDNGVGNGIGINTGTVHSTLAADMLLTDSSGSLRGSAIVVAQTTGTGWVGSATLVGRPIGSSTGVFVALAYTDLADGTTLTAALTADELIQLEDNGLELKLLMVVDVGSVVVSAYSVQR